MYGSGSGGGTAAVEVSTFSMLYHNNQLVSTGRLIPETGIEYE